MGLHWFSLAVFILDIPRSVCGGYYFYVSEAVHKILLMWFSIALCRWMPMCVSVFLFYTPSLPTPRPPDLVKQSLPSAICLLNNWDSRCSVASEWPQRPPITSPLCLGCILSPPPNTRVSHLQKRKSIHRVISTLYFALIFIWNTLKSFRTGIFFFLCASPVSSSKNHLVFWAHLQRPMTSWSTSVGPTFIRIILFIYVYSFKTFASCPFFFLFIDVGLGVSQKYENSEIVGFP